MDRLKTVHVLCLNDFPEEVFESKEAADKAKRTRNDPDHGRYFHVREVPFTSSGLRSVLFQP